MARVYELAEYLQTERVIQAPARRLWPVFLDMNGWYTDYHWDWISGAPYGNVGLQEGQVLKVTPLYGAGLRDPSLFYYQEQLKITPHSEIVVKLTADDPLSMSSEYGAEVRDLVAFYHWHFTDLHDSTLIVIRSFSHIRIDKRPSESNIDDLVAFFHLSWNKCLDNLAALVGG